MKQNGGCHHLVVALAILLALASAQPQGCPRQFRLCARFHRSRSPPRFRSDCRRRNRQPPFSSDSEMDTPALEGELDVPAQEGELDMPALDGELDLPAQEGELDLPAPEGELDIMPALEGELDDLPALEGELDDLPALEGELDDLPALEGELDDVMSPAEGELDDSESIFHDHHEGLRDSDWLTESGDEAADAEPMTWSQAVAAAGQHRVVYLGRVAPTVYCGWSYDAGYTEGYAEGHRRGREGP